MLFAGLVHHVDPSYSPCFLGSYFSFSDLDKGMLLFGCDFRWQQWWIVCATRDSTMMSDGCLLTPRWTRSSCVFYRPTTTWFLLTDRGRRLSVSSTKSQLSADFPWKPSPRQSDWTLQTILQQASTSIKSQQKGSQIPPHAQARR